MTRTVSATEARIHLGALLDDIERNGAITVEQAGHAETVVISVTEAQELSSAPTGSPDWRQSLERARASFARDLGDRPRSDFVQMIREMREERSGDSLVIQPITLFADINHHARALRFSIQFNLPAAYDAHYLALAEELGCEFWTADKRLARAVRDELDWVHLFE